MEEIDLPRCGHLSHGFMTPKGRISGTSFYFESMPYRLDESTGTPLWQNEPPEKPVLCNACSSRWRTKGRLANYTPLHARADPDKFEDPQFSSKVKTIFIKNKEPNNLKCKLDNGAFAVI